MLVSSIARFNSVNTMNNAGFASTQSSNARVNAVHAFGGERNLSMLNSIDKKLSLDLLTNKLLYKIAFLQEKLASKQLKNKLNILA